MDELSFAYPEHKVIEDITFEVNEGEFMGLVGANGAGKTTIIKCVNGILNPAGSVKLNGTDVQELRRVEIARRMAYVPQSNTTTSAATVFDLILMGRRPYLRWKVSPEDEEAVMDAMELLEIEDFAFRKVKELSGGERQRVMIARAIAQGAPVLLLDEPTSALDVRNQIEVMELLRKLAVEKEMSILMAIHDLNMAARYCHRLVMLNKGTIYLTGTPEEVFTNEAIEAVYGIEAMIGADDENKPFVLPLRAVKKPGI